MKGAGVLATIAAVCAAASALAQDSADRGVDPADFSTLRGLFGDDLFVELPPTSLEATAPPGAASRAWHQTITLTPSGDIGYLSNDSFTFDESLFSLGDDRAWGFTLAVQEARAPWSETPDFDTYRAGAFVNLGSRFRLGGELRFSDAEKDVLFFDRADDAPEIKLQSAFRF